MKKGQFLDYWNTKFRLLGVGYWVIQFGMILIILIAVSVQSDARQSDDRPPITFSGSTTLSGQYANIPAAGSQLANEFLRYQINATLGVYGMPINAQLYLTTEPSRGRSNQQRFSISANPRLLHNRLPVISWFTDFTFGRTAPTYSRFTLQGTRVDGFSAEMNPGSVYLAFVTGRAERSSGAATGRPGFDRNVIGGKIGYGDPQKSHLHLTYLRIRDDTESLLPVDRPFGITPAENHVAGLKGGLNFGGRTFRLEGEVAGSVFTRDSEEASIDGLDQIPDWLKDWINPNISTSFDYAWSVNSQLNLANTRVNGGAEWVGPGYRTLGNLWLRNDLFSWNSRVEQFFHNRRIYVHAQARQNRDNLIPWKDGTTYTTSYGFGLGLRFPGYPSLQINVAPHYQENSPRGIDIKTMLVSVMSSYTHRFGVHQSTTSVFASWQGNSTHNPMMDYTRYMFSLNEVFVLNRVLTLRGSFTWNKTEFELMDFSVVTGELGASYRKNRNIVFNGGARLASQADYGSRFGFYAGGEVGLGPLGTLSVHAEQSFFRDDFDGMRDYDQSLVRASLTKRW